MMCSDSARAAGSTVSQLMILSLPSSTYFCRWTLNSSSYSPALTIFHRICTLVVSSTFAIALAMRCARSSWYLNTVPRLTNTVGALASHPSSSASCSPAVARDSTMGPTAETLGGRYSSGTAASRMACAIQGASCRCWPFIRSSGFPTPLASRKERVSPMPGRVRML